MADRYEMELVVHVSYDFASEANEVIDYFAGALYEDKHPNFWVNHVGVNYLNKAYDPETGEDCE